MVRLYIMTLWLVLFYWQYQFFLYFIIMRYSDLDASSSSSITCPLCFGLLVVGMLQIAILSHNIPFWLDTREGIFSLIPPSTALYNSSKSSLGVVLLVNWMMFQSLKGHNTDQCVQSKKCWYRLIRWRTRKFRTTKKKSLLKNAEKKRHQKSKRSNIMYFLTIYFLTKTTQKCTNFVDTLLVLHFSIIFCSYFGFR